MSVKGECAWAMVYIRESKYLCCIQRKPGEGQAKFGARSLSELYRLYCEQFKEYPKLSIDRNSFNRIVKAIDSKFGSWRYKGEKESYLKHFSTSNRKKGRLTLEGKKSHNLSGCRTCQMFNSSFQCTFPDSKFCRIKNSGPLGDSEARKLTKPKNRLKEVGQTIYSTSDEKSEEKNNIKRIAQKNTKKDIENKMRENYINMHLHLRQSFSARNAQTFAQYFESKEEATERVQKISPEAKSRSHTLSFENIDGSTA